MTRATLVARDWRWAVVAAVAAALVLAHGCHGDADHELFVGWLIR